MTFTDYSHRRPYPLRTVRAGTTDWCLAATSPVDYRWFADAGSGPLGQIVSHADFSYVTPGAALSGLVAFHYVLCTNDAPFDEILCALLGQVQIGIGGAATWHVRGGAFALPSLAVIGPTDRAVRMRAPAGFVAVGSALTPAGWHVLVGPDRALMNAVLPAATVFGDIRAPLATRSTSTGTALAALDAFLTDRATTRGPDPRIAAIDRWIVETPDSDPATLAAELALSRRALERLTAATHGAPPKRLSAKYRALMAAARLAVGDAVDWRTAAPPGAFADQAHFIREFRRYVGVTPGQFIASDDRFVRRLIRGQWQPGRELGIAIWS